MVRGLHDWRNKCDGPSNGVSPWYIEEKNARPAPTFPEKIDIENDELSIVNKLHPWEGRFLSRVL